VFAAAANAAAISYRSSPGIHCAAPAITALGLSRILKLLPTLGANSLDLLDDKS
jgi:hypothetical protein